MVLNINNLIKNFIDKSDSVLDLGCGIGLPLRGVPCQRLVGVDAFDYSKDYCGEFINQELPNLTQFSNKSFDVVLCVDCIEHLSKENGLILMREIERIAKKRILIYTPIVWDTNEVHVNDSTCWAYGNPFNLHKSHWKHEDFSSNNYTMIDDDKYIIAMKFLGRSVQSFKEIGSSEDFISVIVTTFNRKNNLKNALYSIYSQDFDVPFEVIVVDDGSTDNTRVMIENLSKKYNNLIYLPVVRGGVFRNPGVAHNLGLIYCKGNIIIQSGADILHKKDTFQTLYSAYKTDEALYSAIVFKLDEEYIKEVPIFNRMLFDKYVDRYSVRYNLHYPVGDYQNATPFCSIFKKENAFKIGLYDEEFFMGGGEDCDFIYRMQKVCKTKWLHEAVCIHQEHPKYSGRQRDEHEYNENLKRLTNSRDNKIENRWRKKIFCIGSFNAHPNKGYLWDSMKQSLLRLGHECYFYDVAKEPWDDEVRNKKIHQLETDWSSPEVLQDVLEKVHEFKPNIILGGTPYHYNIMRELKKSYPAYYVAWYGDYHPTERLKDFKGVFNMMFLTNRHQMYPFRELLNCTVHPISFGVSCVGHRKEPLEKKYDVTFSGIYHKTLSEHHIHKNRFALLNKIDAKFNLFHFTDKIDKTYEYYNQSKIIINDICDLAIQDKALAYTSNRFFNIIGSGNFCLSRYFEGIEFFGEPGTHFETFKTDEECLEKIEYFLKCNELREKIALNGYFHFHKFHDFIDKFRFMMDKVRSGMEGTEHKKELGEEVYAEIEDYFNNQSAEWYSANITQKIIEEYSQFIGGNVLDIGCHQGFITSQLSKYCKKVYAVDVNRRAIAHALFNSVEKNLLFMEGNALDLNHLQEQFFDTIVSFELIEHIFPEHLDKFFENCVRLLKDSGYLILKTPVDAYKTDPVNHRNFLFEDREKGIAYLNKWFNVSIYDKEVRTNLNGDKHNHWKIVLTKKRGGQ